MQGGGWSPPSAGGGMLPSEALVFATQAYHQATAQFQAHYSTWLATQPPEVTTKAGRVMPHPSDPMFHVLSQAHFQLMQATTYLAQVQASVYPLAVHPPGSPGYAAHGAVPTTPEGRHHRPSPASPLNPSAASFSPSTAATTPAKPPPKRMSYSKVAATPATPHKARPAVATRGAEDPAVPATRAPATKSWAAAAAGTSRGPQAAKPQAGTPKPRGAAKASRPPQGAKKSPPVKGAKPPPPLSARDRDARECKNPEGALLLLQRQREAVKKQAQEQRCFGCEQYGHIKADCPNKHLWRCRVCKEPGHLSKDCIMRTQVMEGVLAVEKLPIVADAAMVPFLAPPLPPPSPPSPSYLKPVPFRRSLSMGVLSGEPPADAVAQIHASLKPPVPPPAGPTTRSSPVGHDVAVKSAPPTLTASMLPPRPPGMSRAHSAPGPSLSPFRPFAMTASLPTGDATAGAGTSVSPTPTARPVRFQ